MSRALQLRSPDLLVRRALFGVELVDPVTLEIVHRQMKVQAPGLVSPPRVSGSGRFFWLTEEETAGAWPQRLIVDPGGRPFEPIDEPAPTPADLEDSKGLHSISLRPTSAYPFPGGVTVVRGRLREDPDPESDPIAGAEVWLSRAAGQAGGWIAEKTRSVTVSDGGFAAFTRGAAKPGNDPADKPLILVSAKRGNVERSREVELSKGVGNVTDLGAGGLAWSQMQ